MCRLVWAALHLRESPRYYPSAGPWLDFALSADPHVAPFLGRRDRTRNSGTAKLAFPGLGKLPRMPSPFHGEDGEAEEQDAEQSGEG